MQDPRLHDLPFYRELNCIVRDYIDIGVQVYVVDYYGQVIFVYHDRESFRRHVLNEHLVLFEHKIIRLNHLNYKPEEFNNRCEIEMDHGMTILNDRNASNEPDIFYANGFDHQAMICSRMDLLSKSEVETNVFEPITSKSGFCDNQIFYNHDLLVLNSQFIESKGYAERYEKYVCEFQKDNLLLTYKTSVPQLLYGMGFAFPNLDDIFQTHGRVLRGMQYGYYSKINADFDGDEIYIHQRPNPVWKRPSHHLRFDLERAMIHKM